MNMETVKGCRLARRLIPLLRRFILKAAWALYAKFKKLQPVWKVLVGLGVLVGPLGIWAFVPVVIIEPGKTTNPQDALQTRFEVSNQSAYGLGSWRYDCMLKVRPPVGVHSLVLVHMDIDSYAHLGRGARSSMRCDIPTVDGKLIDHALISVTVHYHAWVWPTERTSASMFFLQRDEVDRHAEWLPVNGGIPFSDALAFMKNAEVP